MSFMTISNAARQVLDQLAEVIVQLDANNYSQPIPRLGNSTLGQHVRHTLEFFICLKEGTDRGIINYDHRRRDQDLENKPSTAFSTITKIQEFIESTDPEFSMKLVVDYGLEGNDSQLMDTNFNRELAYNIEHAVHHMAILKIGLAEITPHIKIPEGFGIAVSTLRFRKEQAPHT